MANKVHRVGSDRAPFQDVWSGVKKAEVRVDDRGYAANDELGMFEIDELGVETGRSIIAKITHIQRGYGLPENLVVLSFKTLRMYRANGELLLIRDPENAAPTSIGFGVPWSRFVTHPDGKFSNGRFHYEGEAVEVVRQSTLKEKPPVTYVPRTFFRDLDGKLLMIDNFASEPDETLDYGCLMEQARAWQEVAHCIHEIDPDWHQNGRPMDSAVKFIKNACKPPYKLDCGSPGFFTPEEQRVTLAVAKLLRAQKCEPGKWYCFEVRMTLRSSDDHANYSFRDMGLYAEPVDVFDRMKTRGNTIPAALGAPYRGTYTVSYSERGVKIEAGFVATPYEPLPSGAAIATSLGINAQPVYNKAPGEHPADRIDNGEL